MGGEAPGTVKAGCFSIGKCYDSEAGVSGWEGEYLPRSRGRRVG